jgi:hypothetical protein
VNVGNRKRLRAALMRSIAELSTMLMIGDGVMVLAVPRRHSLLLRFGPEAYRRTMEAFADRPTLTGLLAAAEVGLDLWLALKQYSKE